MSSSSPEMPQFRDFAAIEAAVRQTERGRWFLAEFASRQRRDDAAAILAALDRVDRQVKALSDRDHTLPFRKALTEIAAAIAATQGEIGCHSPGVGCPGRLITASGELDAVVRAAEAATASILTAAEKMQEQAWTLRERGGAPLDCDALEASATEIYLACASQDIAAQRIRKVTETLRFVETRIATLLDVLGIERCAKAYPQAAEDSPVFDQPRPLWPDTPGVQSAVDAILADPDIRPAATEGAPPRRSGLSVLDMLTPDERLRLFV
ncbi:MAG TPA: hypothetical protein PLQ11_08255 [Beijerinckiaceae bacterium]|nr:hypothetical protein [Beijerinckiaceae bacterium]